MSEPVVARLSPQGRDWRREPAPQRPPEVPAVRGRLDRAAMLALQRTAGNAAVTALLAGGRPVLARDPDTVAAEPAPPDAARALLLPGYESLFAEMAHRGADSTGFGDHVAEHAIDTLPGLDEEQAARVEQRGLAVGEIREEAAGTIYDIPAALQAIAAVHEQASGAVPGLQLSLGLKALVRALARSAAAYVAGGLAPAPVAPASDLATLEVLERAQLIYQLHVAVEALSDAQRMLELELEGTLDELVRLRRSFSASDLERDARAVIGGQIGEVARRVLLLDDALTDMREYREAGLQEPPLERALQEVATEIAAIRTTASAEEDTRELLGDKPELLGQQLVDLEEPHMLDAPGPYPIEPDEAFPEATDEASNAWMSDLAERLREQRADVVRLRGDVIPETPGYTLDEFAQVFRRWYALVSHEQEEQDPILQMWLELVGGVWDITGRDVGDPLVAVEGGIARAWLMDFAADHIARSLGGPSIQFAGPLGRAGGGRTEPEVAGSASAPEYSFAELFPDLQRDHPLTGEGERSSREARAGQARAGTSAAYTYVSLFDPGRQPGMAEQVGITRGGRVPLVHAGQQGGPGSPVGRRPGLRAVSAQEGWSYLIDVFEPTKGELVAREHKVMPPEVAAYMLARRQQLGALQRPHHPHAGGQRLGELAIRAGGVEAGEGAAAARYLGGETEPELSDAARELQSALGEARSAAGVVPKPGEDPSQLIVRTLRDDLQRYLDAYFATRTDMGYRLSSVLVIGEVEWGFARQLAGLVDPEVIGEIVKEALELAARMALLNALGPLGRIAARAYQAYLAAQGVSDVAGMIGVIGFCRNAADADGLRSARAWARLGRPIADDIGELFETLVATPVNAGIDLATHARPSSARELAEACRPLMDDPASRAALLDGLDARIRELEDAGGMLRSDSELEALQAFRDELLAGGAPFNPGVPGAADMELPGRSEETRAEQFFEPPRVRTREERAALEAELGDLASEVAIVEDAKLRGTATVQVRYDGDELRMHIGSRAEAENVRWHVDTARQMLRYKGVLGKIRELIERIGSLLRLHAGYGTLGWEARLEVQKLNAILEELEARRAAIEARAERMSGDPRTAAAEARAIEAEIAGYRRQLIDYEGQIGSFESGRGFVAALSPATASKRAADLVAGHPDLDAKFDKTAASYDALAELFARAGGGAPGATSRPGRYVPVHTRAAPSEMRTLLDYAGRAEVKSISLIPSSSAGRTPDMVVEIEEADGTRRVERVEITTVTGARRGYQARGSGGGRAAEVDDIVGRVRSKALPSNGVSQLVAPLPGGVPAGGTIVVHVLRGGPDAKADVRTAMARLAQELQAAPHVHAIEFDLRGAGVMRFERRPNGTYAEVT